MQTLECVSSQELKDFLSSEEVTLMSTETEHWLEIKNSFFDFSKIDDHWREKTLTLKGSRIYFDKCIFIGGLKFKDCSFENISIKHCHFIKHQFGVEPGSLTSLSFTNVDAKWLTIEKSYFDSPIEIHQGGLKEVKVNYVTCPQLWFQSMDNSGATLSVYRFLGRGISLPSERKFDKLWLDDLILRQVTGDKRNLSVNFVDLR